MQFSTRGKTTQQHFLISNAQKRLKETKKNWQKDFVLWPHLDNKKITFGFLQFEIIISSFSFLWQHSGASTLTGFWSKCQNRQQYCRYTIYKWKLVVWDPDRSIPADSCREKHRWKTWNTVVLSGSSHYHFISDPMGETTRNSKF